MTHRALIISAIFAVAALTTTRASAADLPITAQEFKLWRDYQSALEDPRVQKMAEKDRIPNIARNFRVPEKVLREAIAKGEEYGEKVGPTAEEAIRAAFDDTELSGRIQRVKVDASGAHPIAYVTWLPDRPERFDREACLVAARVRKAAPLVGTIKLEVSNPGGPEGTFQFEALISAASADRIDERKIVDFASTRYIKLFEKVKRLE
jgi:hypothetical protein